MIVGVNVYVVQWVPNLFNEVFDESKYANGICFVRNGVYAMKRITSDRANYCPSAASGILIRNQQGLLFARPGALLLHLLMHGSLIHPIYNSAVGVVYVLLGKGNLLQSNFLRSTVFDY